MNERLISLLNFLELNHNTKVEEVKDMNHVYNINSEKYMILTNEEANITHENYIQNTIDNYGSDEVDKLDVDYIIQNCMDSTYFDCSLEGHYEMYADEIECEGAFSNNFKTRLEEEMAEENCKDKDSFIKHLCSLHESSIQWYRDIFGDDGLLETASDHGAIDIKKVSEFYIDEYGRGYNLSDYNGEELKLANGYYAYRLY